jgi:hypothetical protein
VIVAPGPVPSGLASRSPEILSSPESAPYTWAFAFNNSRPKAMSIFAERTVIATLTLYQR